VPGKMDWFKGKSTVKPHISIGKSMVSCRFFRKNKSIDRKNDK
jgi:hypothetical protein